MKSHYEREKKNDSDTIKMIGFYKTFYVGSSYNNITEKQLLYYIYFD